MKLYGSVIKIKPEKFEECKKLPAAACPVAMKKIKELNSANYLIFYGVGYLFSYFGYLGNDYEGDMQKMADYPETQKCRKLADPCQKTVEVVVDFKKGRKVFLYK